MRFNSGVFIVSEASVLSEDVMGFCRSCAKTCSQVADAEPRTEKRRLDRAVIDNLAVFQDLTRDALDDVLAEARPRRLLKGNVVYEQGGNSNTFFILLDGRVKIVQIGTDGDQTIVRFMGPGDFFGCAAALDRPEYPCSATAVVDSVALVWDAGAMRALLARHPALALSTLRMMGGRLQEAHSRLRELSTERVERRIARAVMRLVRQAGRNVEDGVRIEFPIGRQDIAEMTGTTLHTVSRVLSGWEQLGFTRSSRQRIVIRNPHALVVIAEDL